MKALLLIALFLIFYSCSRHSEKAELSDFQKYLSSLGEIPLPINFDTKMEIISISRHYDTSLFKKYRQVNADRPYGKISIGDSVIATVDIVPGDVLVPIIMTYTKEGKKIDSLYPYNGGWDIGLEWKAFLTISKDQEIVISDSSRRWELNKEQNDTVAGTMRLTVDTTLYRINHSGRFVKAVG